MPAQERFSERLIAAEQADGERKEHHAMELHRILHQTLTPARRIAYGAAAVLGLFLGADWGWIAIGRRITGEYAAWGHVVFGAFALLALAGAFITGRIAIKGTVDLARDRTIMARLVWYFSALVCLVALLAGGLQLRYGSGKWAVLVAVAGVAYLIAGAMVMIKNLVQQSELRVREQMLKLELRLVELGEKLGE